MQPGCVFHSKTVRRGPARVASSAVGGLVALLVAACGAGYPSPAAQASARAVSHARPSATVWLCRPGQMDDPCASPLNATVVPAHGARTRRDARARPGSRFDCFYVYPTVSTQSADNSNLKVQRAETAAATAQASRFSQVCRVWAPMYRQRTEASLLQGLGADPHGDAVAYASLLSAWKDYLAHDNHGRPIVFIGHSQGAAMLIRLLANQVDPNPALRARTLVAILAGGNVTVPIGKALGATFRHLPLCTAAAQIGCVIAYSSFPSQPPSQAVFGRPGQGVSLQSGQTTTRGVQVACVNPADIGGGTADLDPYFLTATSTPPPPLVDTPWVTYPRLYSATCRSAGGATWLQVNTLARAGRPVASEPLGPAWGYHLDDINLALGNLVADVKAEEVTYTGDH